MSRSLFHCPVHHSIGYNIGYCWVQSHTGINCFFQFHINIFRQFGFHRCIVEYHAAKHIRHIHSCGFHFIPLHVLSVTQFLHSSFWNKIKRHCKRLRSQRLCCLLRNLVYKFCDYLSSINFPALKSLSLSKDTVLRNFNAPGHYKKRKP